MLTTHVRPDGDALGSELAMAAILEALGKDVLLCNAFAVPPNLRFLDPRQKLGSWASMSRPSNSPTARC